MTLTQSTNRYKWVVWGTLAVAFFIVFFHRYSTAVVSDDLARDLALSGTQLSNLASMYFYAYALMQVPSGILADYLGPRRTCAMGMLLAAVGSVMFAAAGSLGLAYAGRLLVGLGVSVVFVSILKTQAVWFRPREFAMISGLTTTVGNLGGMAATVPLALLVMAMGWRNTFYLIGAISALVAVSVYLLVRDKPEDMRLAPQVALPAAEDIGVLDGLRRVLSTPATWPGVFILAGVMGGINSFSGLWGIPYLMHVYGMNKPSAANLLLALTAGVLIGSPLMGYLADRLGRRKPLILLGAGVYTAVWGLIIAMPQGAMNTRLLYALFFLAGLGGISFFLTFALAKEANHPRLSGIAMGVVNTGGFLSAAILNLMIGMVLDANWQGAVVAGAKAYPDFAYRTALLFYFLAGIAAIAVASRIKEN